MRRESAKLTIVSAAAASRLHSAMCRPVPYRARSMAERGIAARMTPIILPSRRMGTAA